MLRKRSARNRGISMAPIVLVLLLLMAVPMGRSLPGGYPDSQHTATCGTSCHGPIGINSGKATLDFHASKIELDPGETGVLVTADVSGSEQEPGQYIEAMLVSKLADDGWDPLTLGWTIASDPNGNDPPVNAVEKLAQGSIGDTSASFTWDMTAPSVPGTYNLYVRVQYAGGPNQPVAIDDQVGLTFNVKGPSIPEVVSTDPIDGATNVTLSAQIKVVFSMDMDPVLTKAAFSITPAVTTDMIVSGNVLTVTPTQPFSPLTSYKITILSSAQSIGGEALAADHVFNFTTGSEVDTEPPFVTASHPSNGSKNVPVTSNIRIEFNEPMDKASVEAAFSTDPSTDGTFSWEGSLMVFKPSNYLVLDANYTVTIDISAQDLSGNALVPFVLDFKTNDILDLTNPTVLAHSPMDGAKDIVMNAHLRFLFSEPMNESATEAGFLIEPPVVGVFNWFENNMTFVPVQPLLYLTEYAVSFGPNATDRAWNPLETFSMSFKTGTVIDLNIPKVISTKPTNGTRTNDNSGPVITFSEVMDVPSVLSKVSINPIVNGSWNWSNDHLSMRFDASPSIPDGEYAVTLLNGSMDTEGDQVVDTYFFTFTVDTQKPELISSTIEDGERDVSRDVVLTFQFSESMDNVKTDASFSMGPEPSGLSLNWTSGSTVVVEHDGILDPNTDYTLMFKGGASDLSGNPLSDTTIIFRTFGVPGVLSMEHNVSAGKLIITFNESMNHTSVEEGLTISPSVPGVIKWDGASMEYEFSNPLRKGKRYTVTLNTLAKDVDGTFMLEAFSDGFDGPKNEKDNFGTPIMLLFILIILMIFGLIISRTWAIVRRRKLRATKARKRAVREFKRTKHLTLFERAYLSLFSWIDERLRIRDLRKGTKIKELRHTINRQIPKTHTADYKVKTVWYWYPLYCLGGIATLSFILLCITGIILAFYYIPSGDPTFNADGIQGPSEAYNSMLRIMTTVPFGYILRGLHHWGTHIMVASVFLHMCRVYFVGAYKKPRELNWLLGVALMGLTIFFGFTGYLLPWDQLSYWAGTIGVNIATSVPYIGDTIASIVFGGGSMSSATVIRMYFLHVFLLPIVVFSLMIVHMMIVWYQGMAEPH